jgi:hypothetical protein
MTIRITVAEKTKFSVRGTITSESGAAESFEFRLTARRMGTAALQAALSDTDLKVDGFLADVVLDWQGVLDDEGREVQFSQETMDKLFDSVSGLSSLAFKAYLEANGAKEKN